MKTMTGKELGEKLLRSVRQMQRGEAARTTRVKPNVAAKARAIVIPGLPAAVSRAEPGIQLLALRYESWIPGSIADEAGDGPGMTSFL